jgi:uncharacterized protein YigA (DUF484 family)
MSSSRLRWGACLGAVFALCFASLAAAEEVTRDSYREAVEPICKQNAQANMRIFNGVRTMVRQHRFKGAAARFDRAAEALKQTVAQLRRVPEPPADETRLKKWLDDVSAEVSLFEQTAAKLRTGDTHAALRLVSRLTHQANVSNAVVVPFEFHYCKLDPSRFT